MTGGCDRFSQHQADPAVERISADQPGLVSPLFVGRGAELSSLVAGLESAMDGEPVVVLVGGEAGVRKTRLVEEAPTRARADGARVLVGSCIELGGEGLPLGPVVDVLRSLVRQRSDDELDGVLGPARTELARLLPELDPHDPVAAASPGGAEGDARLLERVFGVVERLAVDRPLMLVIENLHWADRSTLDLVALLVRALRGTRVLRGDFEAARALVREALDVDVRAGGEAYRWPVVWLGVRVEAEAPTVETDRVSALAEAVATLTAATPPARAYRALATAEHARVVGEQPRWREAIDVCRQDGDPYLIAYALLRSVEADIAAGGRERAARALDEAAGLADGLGAALVLEDAHMLARRARLKLTSAVGTR